jgi:hypothetical protein
VPEPDKADRRHSVISFLERLVVPSLSALDHALFFHGLASTCGNSRARSRGVITIGASRPKLGRRSGSLRADDGLLTKSERADALEQPST